MSKCWIGKNWNSKMVVMKKNWAVFLFQVYSLVLRKHWLTMQMNMKQELISQLQLEILLRSWKACYQNLINFLYVAYGKVIKQAVRKCQSLGEKLNWLIHLRNYYRLWHLQYELWPGLEMFGSGQNPNFLNYSSQGSESFWAQNLFKKSKKWNFMSHQT